MAMRVIVLVTLLCHVHHVSCQDVADCTWLPSSEEDSGKSELECHLKTLQTGPAVIPQVQNANSLRLQCSDMYLYESVMSRDQFGTLPQMTQLSVEFCKLKMLPAGAFVGLKNLRLLSIQGHNSEWSGSMTLQLQENTLRGLSKLETLDLSDNNIWGLPSSALCHTPLLNTFNLSRNNIVEVSELGLSREVDPGNCQLLHLRSLDLSYNKISSFLPKDLSLAPGLQSLNLKGNRLSVLPDPALYGLPQLSFLDISHNQLSALPPSLFRKSPNLQKLFLQNNSLSLLSSELFSGLSELLLLNISHNEVSSHLLPDNIFTDLGKLVALDLSYNSLTKLDSRLLAQQNNLQILNLQHNSLANIDYDSFSSLINLHILLLSHNQLSELPQSSLSSLTSLSSLSLDHNRLTILPLGLFTGCPMLQDLALNNNYLDEIPSDIAGLSKLRTLDLGENRITQVMTQQLENLSNLYGLRLAGNQLTRIDGDIFKNNTNLHVLNIAHNQIDNITQEAFKGLKNLRALRLDNNQLKDINGLVSSQKNLKWLNVSTNQIQWFDFAFIPKSLEWLDIHNNKIDKIGNYYNLGKGFSLQTFDASFNHISQLSDTTLLHGLKNIYLNNNKIEKIAAETFKSLENLTRVEIQNNELISLTSDAVITSNTDQLPEFLLAGNPWLCDCNMEWLLSINQRSTGFPRILDLDDVECHLNGPISNNSSLLPVLQLDPGQFMCQYEAHCIPQCFCCDFFACDCRMQCPEGCACYHDNNWSNNIIQCSNRGHQDVPPLIPMDATTVHLDGNNMSELINPGFIGRRRIHTVYLNNSQIRTVTNFSLEGLTELRVLHLESNQLSELTGSEFASLTKLRELYLHNNYIATIAKHTFDNLKELTILRLDNNLLTNFPIWELAANPLITSLSLANNLWSCKCDFLNHFLVYQKKIGGKLRDRSDLRCVTDHYLGEAVTPLDNVICADTGAVHSSSSGSDYQSVTSSVSQLDYTPILVSVLVAVVMIIVGYLLAFTFRRSIKEWLYSKTKLGSAGKNNAVYSNKDKLFDVFISYSVADRDFVEQNFAPNLEHGNTSYRLCLHQRDFPASTPVYDTVSVAVESSARALIVLSRSYLSLEWTQIRQPFMASIMANNTKVVFVQLEDVNQDEISVYQDFKHLLEDSPVVKWGDPGFWNKLRYFLPEPVYLTFHRNVTMRGTLQSSNLYQSVLGNNVLLGQPCGAECTNNSGSHGQHQSNSGANNGNKCEHYNSGTVYSLDHTYHSIDNNHIYHTLDPGGGSTQNLYLQFQSPSHLVTTAPAGAGPNNRVYINSNMDLVQPTPQSLVSSFPRPLPHQPSNDAVPSHVGRQTRGQARGYPGSHNHTNSTSSNKRLLSPEDSEYIV